MKALVVNGIGHGFDLEDVEIAAPMGQEVLIDVQASGLCHTDQPFATHDIVPMPATARFPCQQPPSGIFISEWDGADPTGHSRLAFARYNGAAEKVLLASGFPLVYIFRPAYIYPVEQRTQPNFSYRLLRWIYPALRVIFPSLVIRSDDLAGAMVDVAMRETGERQSLIFEKPQYSKDA